ncbi:MAG: HupE/UreJ family protein, partial [Woeseia sp.]
MTACRNMYLLGTRICLSMMLLLAGPSIAHDSRPLYVELQEEGPTLYRLDWKVPLVLPAAVAPTVTLSDGCTLIGTVATYRLDDGTLLSSNYQCADGLAQQSVVVTYPFVSKPIPALLHFSRLSGELHVAALSPGSVRWSVPPAETRSSVSQTYLVLGFEHVLGGLDHLLFLLCLIWIAGSWRRVIVTATGFTLAHSLTLVLSALGIVRLPLAPVEAVIALSIVFLAWEIVRGRRDSLTWRHPILVSMAFGLVHGLGFASALTDIGLPQVEVAASLLFFNLGIEIGQI